jgi:hypothetical protein
LYTQCGLRRKNVFTVSWIPKQFAEVGRVLKLKGADWCDGWVVEWVGATGEKPAYAAKAIREHRKRTGDSLPKLKDE